MNTLNPSTVAGIVLCGGRSSRMGRAKAWLPFGDETLLQRVVRVLGDVVDPIVVVAAPDSDVPLLPSGVEVVRDKVEHLGPLAGLTVGLTALRGRADAAYLSACDAPFLSVEFVRKLVSEHSRHRSERGLPASRRLYEDAILAPHIDGFSHPLAAVYPVAALDVAMAMLAEGRRRMLDLLDAYPTRFLDAIDFADVDPTLQSLRNVNTPEDYAAALADYNRPLFLNPES